MYLRIHFAGYKSVEAAQPQEEHVGVEACVGLAEARIRQVEEAIFERQRQILACAKRVSTPTPSR